MKNHLLDLLAGAGITIDGPNPFDLQVHDQRFFKRILLNPSLGAGESYMEGWWDCQKLDEFFFRLTRSLDANKLYHGWKIVWMRLINSLINHQTPLRSQQVAKQHYNLDNELYRLMLGESMAYTCAYWKNANTLEEAQYHKYDLICKKLDLQTGDNVLELGCGWGGFAKYAAEKYGCKVVAVNISEEQVKHAKQICVDLPVKIFMCDYRNLSIYNPQKIKFNKVVSIGLCEHIGYKNYPLLMQTVRDNMSDDGQFLLHTIGRNYSVNFVDPWIDKYIFPNGMLPSIKQLAASMEKILVVEDLHNFGSDYDKTLMAWQHNFAHHWPTLSLRYDTKFYRMWNYYLLSCAGVFRARDMQLWQFVMTPKGKLNGYRSIRE